MGTRGAIGFVIDEQVKATYNHFDSYPESLGRDVVDQLRAMLDQNDPHGLIHKAKAIRMIDENSAKPTPEDIEKYRAYADTGVGEQSLEDWYCLLRRLQGNLKANLDLGVMSDGSAFLHDSQFCEYGYLINLDNATLELYRGFQSAPHTQGRFASYDPKTDSSVSYRSDEDHYYGCALVGFYTFQEVCDPSFDAKWIGETYPDEPDDEDEDDQKLIASN